MINKSREEYLAWKAERSTILNGLARVDLLPEPTGLGRLLRRGAPPENAFRKIQNLLASTPIRDVTPPAIERILQEHAVDAVTARPELLRLYRDVLRWFAEDDELSDAEVEDLRRLRDLFGLSAGDVAKAGVEIYQRGVSRAAADRQIAEDERARIAQLAERLQLPERIVQETQRETLGAIYRSVFDRAVEDRRLSPDEETQLRALAKDLGLNVLPDDETTLMLCRLRLLWRVENGELPNITVPIRLGATEQCHATVPVSHHELRRVTRAVAYAGPTYRVRLAKGLSWRMGVIAPAPIRQDVMTELDTGTLYITNRQLLFDGVKGSRNWPYSKVLDVKLFSDGLQVERQTGKDQFFKFTGRTDGELIGVILQAVLRRQG